MRSAIVKGLSTKEYAAAWKVNNIAKVRANNKRYRDKMQNDPVRRAAYNKHQNEFRAAKRQNPIFHARELASKKLCRATPSGWARIQATDISRRCRKLGIEYNLTVEAIIARMPADLKCPVFGVPFVFGHRSPFNASVDRLEPHKGYTVKNIRIISMNANLTKRAFTDPHIFRQIADWLERELRHAHTDNSMGAAS